MKLDKDGIWRDLERWGIEWTDVKVFVRPELKRFQLRKPWEWIHLTTNLPVEAAKIAPWLMGHVVMLETVSILALLSLLYWRW